MTERGQGGPPLQSARRLSERPLAERDTVPHTGNVTKYWSGLAWSIGSSVARLLVSVGSSILFVRYLGDAGYGSVIVMADLVTLLLVLLSFGLGVVQTRELPQLLAKGRKGEARDFIVRVMSIRVGWSLAGSVALLLASGWLRRTIYRGVPGGLLVVAAALFPVQMLSTCFRGTLEVTYHQKQVTLVDVLGLLARVILAVPVMVFDWGVVAFFWTQVFADGLVAVIYGAQFRRAVWAQVRGEPRKAFDEGFLKAGLGMMVLLLASSFIGKELDTQLLSFRLGGTSLPEIAVYSVSFMFASRSLSFVGVGSGGVANLTQAIMSELKIKGLIDDMRSLYESQLNIFYFISTPLVIGGAFLGEALLEMMYGRAFAGRGLVFGLILAGFGGTVIRTLNPAVLYAFRKDRLVIRSRVCWGLLNAIGSYSLAPHGAAGVALATAICMYGVAVTETIMVWRHIHFRIEPAYFLKLTGGSLFMCGAFVLAARAASGLPALVAFAAAGSAGAASYYLAMVVMKPVSRVAMTTVLGELRFSKYVRLLLLPLSA